MKPQPDHTTSPVLALGLLVGISATAAALLSAAAISTSGYLGRLAFDRTPPKTSDKGPKLNLTGNKGASPLPEEVITEAKALQALGETVMESVDITAGDGTRLHGRLYEAKHPKRLLICMHGWRSSFSSDFSVSAPYYHDHLGATLLFPDQRAQGESDGDTIGFGVFERQDTADWAHYLANRYGEELPIYLCGISLGATTVLMAADLPLPSSVRGIIADSGFTSPRAIFAHVTRNNLGIPGPLSHPLIERVLRARLPENLRDYTTVKALNRTTLPVLLIHGTADTFVPIEMTYENYLAAAGEKELLVVPGAGHGLGYLVETDRYRKAIRRFFAKYDRK